MNFLDIFIFILKYIPFWAVPMGLTSAHFAYLYWLKDYREIAYVWGFSTLFCLTSVGIYFVIGGPDQIVQTFTHIFQ
ncbi:MAG: hypothetical protein WC635_16670 [Bacteriovorax sp.]|jgi:hypothetical protein